MSAPTLGRYVLSDLLASGGMSSVHLGRMRGPAGFGRTVAIKRLHPQFARDTEFVSMMLDEARLVSRITHPNVVATLDVLHEEGDLFLVLEYVPGETLATLQRLLSARDERVPIEIVRAVGASLLLGLDAAHEARGADGQPLDIVHRDVSPQNVIVGADGVTRVLDFGVAKAINSSHHSEAGELKGKVAYMSPEQLGSGAVGRASDIYAASVVLWELCAGRRMFDTAEKSQIPFLVMTGAVRSLSTVEPNVPEELADIIMKGLELDPQRRFATAREMAAALEALDTTGRIATARQVAEWIGEIARDSLAERAALVARIERDTQDASSDAEDVRALATNIASGRTPTQAVRTPPVDGPTPSPSSRTRKKRTLLATLGLLVAALVVAGLAGASFLRGSVRRDVPESGALPGQAAAEPAMAPSGVSSSSAAVSTAIASSATPVMSVQDSTKAPTPRNSPRPVRTKPAPPAKRATPTPDGLFDRN